MPAFPAFDKKIDKIYQSFRNKKKVKELLGDRKNLLYYHMHPNRRLKKMHYLFSFPVRRRGLEAAVPFFTISVNKLKRDNKEKFVCIYNNFFVGGIEEVELNFSLLENIEGIRHNIRELKKVVHIFQLAYNNLLKNLDEDVDFYQQ